MIVNGPLGEIGLSSFVEAERPRLGFLGVGWIGRHRMDAIVRAGVADVVAIADPAADLVDNAHTLVPKAVVLQSLDELLQQDLDGVVIATPSALHAEQSIRTLEAGLAVFCQKPLGRNASETAAAVDTARRVDRLLGVDLSYRFVKGVRRMRDMIQSGAIGKVFSVNLVFHNAYGPDKPWFYDARLSGGGCVVDLGIHLVDLALWVLGEPAIRDVSSSLYAKGEKLHDRSTVEDFATAQIALESGTTIALTCSWHLHAGQDADIEASFYGTSGGLALRNVNGSFYDFTVSHFEGTRREILVKPPDEWGGRAAVDWADRLMRSNRFDPSITSVVDAARALDAIYENAGVLTA